MTQARITRISKSSRFVSSQGRVVDSSFEREMKVLDEMRTLEGAKG